MSLRRFIEATPLISASRFSLPPRHARDDDADMHQRRCLKAALYYSFMSYTFINDEMLLHGDEAVSSEPKTIIT